MAFWADFGRQNSLVTQTAPVLPPGPEGWSNQPQPWVYVQVQASEGFLLAKFHGAGAYGWVGSLFDICLKLLLVAPVRGHVHH